MSRGTLLLALSLAAGWALPALAAPTLGAELVLPGAAGKDAYLPAAAYGASTYLVAWQAGRVQQGDIAAVRLDATGKLLDPAPLAVARFPEEQERPRIAFGAGVFLVVWQDLRNGTDYDVYAARVTPDGSLPDGSGFLVSGGAHNQVEPHVAFDGQNFFVAWQDFRSASAYQIYGARITPQGTVLDPDGLQLASGFSFNDAIASSGDGRTLVLWGGTDNGGGSTAPSGVFVGNGALLPESVATNGKNDPAPFPAQSERFSVAAGPAGFFVACTNYAPSGKGGAINTSAGEVLGLLGERGPYLTFTGRPHFSIDPDVVWDGSAYLVAWGDQAQNSPAINFSTSQPDSRVYASRLSQSGAVLGTPGSPSLVAGSFQNPAQHPAVASDGAGSSLIAYERHPSSGDVPIAIGVRMLEGP